MGKFLFTISVFVSVGTDCQSMFYIPIILLKENIDGVRVPKF